MLGTGGEYMKKGQKTGSAGWKGLGMQCLSPPEVDRIHSATLEVLYYHGIKVLSHEALLIMAEGGAEVDFESNMVYIPPYLVETCIESAPSYVILAGRNSLNDVYLGGKRVHFTTFGAGSKVVDPFTGLISPATKTDVGLSALVCDALDSVDIFTSTLVATDMPTDTSGLHEAEAFLLNTTKHCQHDHLDNGIQTRRFFQMAAAIAGGWEQLEKRPIVSTMACPSSPLQLPRGVCEVIVESAKARVPVNILPMVMSGATGPVTVAGSLVVQNAEVLAGIVLNQLTSKGAPVIYGSSSTIFDMNYLTAPVGAPELGMISGVAAELARYYLLPSYVAGT